MTNIRLRGNISHFKLIANAAITQVGIDNKGKLIRRAKTARKWHCANNNMPTAFGDQLLIGLPNVLGMINRANGMGITTVWPRAFDFLEKQLSPGSDD